MGALYRLTFPNGKRYIGITSTSVHRRMIVHRHHVRTGRLCARHCAIRKYGDPAVETLIVANDWNYLCDMEIAAIAAFSTRAPDGYNLTIGGEGIRGVKWTPEQRAAQSARLKGKNIGNRFAKGYRHTDEAKERIAAAGRGAMFTQDRCAKIGATKIGNKYNLGRSCSPEKAQKISAAQKGRPLTEAHKQAMRGIKKGKPWSVARRAAQTRGGGHEVTPS